MHGSITARCRRLTVVSAAALALTIIPYRIALHGSAPGIDAASAQAANGGNGGGNGGGGNGGNGGGGSGGNGGNGGNSGGGNGGNSSGGNGGNSGGGNGGNSGGGNGGNSSGGNSGNGNGNGGNSGTDGSGDNSASGKGQSDKGVSHVNAATGDKVSVSGNKITVTHPDGITEKIENGRFKMKDALGRTIIDRRATPADVSRLKAL
ncbi:hypothetical protein BFX40_04685 [Mesorhizobium sp. SEMIA 3007]|uniref:hypothetical protein n=1 Tax=Mesorhizobium sp. SEMIA 3007 TaxID=1862350 RepID=UPI00083CF94F|nr:hypothetical protein [Mesorhizobium sp. SEMIA 3007]ODA92258.1 hypothetical protein BFX40_04685 [Mesorhizobium sp. SEMIA 3007]